MRDEIVVHAPAQRIFAAAADTERWPQILPHYRFVRLLAGDAERRIVEMGARQPQLGIPVRWRAEQINTPQTPQIFFRHIEGWTRGMLVYWRFEAVPEGTRVTIDHDFPSPLAPFIAMLFIHPIATRTLACMKALTERDA